VLEDVTMDCYLTGLIAFLVFGPVIGALVAFSKALVIGGNHATGR
jgi:hypothetical protein